MAPRAVPISLLSYRGIKTAGPGLVVVGYRKILMMNPGKGGARPARPSGEDARLTQHSATGRGAPSGLAHLRLEIVGGSPCKVDAPEFPTSV